MFTQYLHVTTECLVVPAVWVCVRHDATTPLWRKEVCMGATEIEQKSA